MASDGDWPRYLAPLTTGRPPARRVRFRPRALLRSMLLAVGVFGIALLVGSVLSGPAPAVPADPPGPGRSEPAAATGPASELIFAHSLIYTGSAGLAVSIAGLVMIGRRRRFW